MNIAHTIRILLINIVIIMLTIMATEVTLKLYFPYHVATIGHRDSPNSYLYGWGFAPNDEVRILDPDNGSSYSSRVNSHGWRDKERTYENTKKSYRILIIGDSVTFGAIVPQDKTYTAILEEKLKKNGFNAEVINIGYGGWGTDQELEAFKNDGIHYKPDLIIVQFTRNDLRDNIYYLHSGESIVKPFYYTVENGALKRHVNALFDKRNNKLSARLKRIIQNTELYKRIYAITLMRKNIYKYNHPTYKIDEKKIYRLINSTNLGKDTAILEFFRQNLGKDVTRKELEDVARVSGLQRDMDIILKIFEDRWFNSSFRTESFYQGKEDQNAIEWKIYLGIMAEFNRLAKQNNAKLAVFNESEYGHYEWLKNWYFICPEKTYKDNYLSHIPIIQKFSRDNGIYFIGNTKTITRAVNDPHPNVAGNTVIADALFDFICSNFRTDMLRHAQ